MPASPAPCRIALLVLLGLVLLACPQDERADSVSKPPPWPSGRLISVAIVGEGTILIAAEHGEIHRSEDAGKTWKRARGPAVNSLSALAMADADVGWAVGDGVILKTDEAGLAWRRQRLPRRADEVQLMGVAALDRDRAIAVGADGLRFYTHDGGAVWKDASGPLIAPSREGAGLAPSRSVQGDLYGDLQDDLHDVACEEARLNRCWAVGAGLYLSRDAGITWEAVPISHFDSTEPIEFAFGGVEIAEEDAERVRALATKWRSVSPLSWRIEVSVMASEVERISRQSDPAALLEIVEARAQEAQSLLEDAGIDAARIEVIGAPPWNYEDSLDEDPELLQRYFAARTQAVGAVRIHLDDQARLHALALSGDGHAVAVGEAGKVARRVQTDGGAFSWKVEGRKGSQDLFAVAMAPGGRPVMVGAQGGFWAADASYDPDVPGGLTQQSMGEGPGAFGAIRDVTFGEEPGEEPGEAARPLGVAVGELGRIWINEGKSPTWAVRISPTEGAHPTDVAD